MQRSRGAVSGRKHLFSFCAVLSFILFLAPFANAAGKSFKVTLLTEGTKSDVPNQLAIRGLQEASSLYFIQTNVLNLREKFFFFPCETCRSPGRLNGLENNMSSASDLTIANGFFFADLIAEAFQNSPHRKYAIVDLPLGLFFPELPSNLWSSDFAVEQPSFLAGYLSAGSSVTKIVATYGGIDIPPVTAFMHGFEQGVAYWNATQNDDVVVLPEQFADSFPDAFGFDAGLAIGTDLIQQGADRIFPVAGFGPFGVLQAIHDQNVEGSVRMIGVDVDWALISPENKALILTSVLKNFDRAVLDAVQWGLDQNSGGKFYLGTLENGGTGLAPLNEEVQNFQGIMDSLTQSIIQGDIVPLP